MLLVAIDIGNSSINIGLFSGPVILWKLKLPTYPLRTAEAYRGEIDALLSKIASGEAPAGVIISSVVPEVTGIVREAVRELSPKEPLLLNASLDTGLSFDLYSPEEIGSDRIADVVAAREGIGEPVGVIDFGTATTVSVCKDGIFLGGAILPGIGLMADALHRGTARLPLVEIDRQPVDVHAVGRDTNKCIISGIIYGTAGAVERLVTEIEREMGCTFRIAITGGYCYIMAGLIRRDFNLEPDLTLKGLRLIYERNA